MFRAGSAELARMFYGGIRNRLIGLITLFYDIEIRIEKKQENSILIPYFTSVKTDIDEMKAIPVNAFRSFGGWPKVRVISTKLKQSLNDCSIKGIYLKL